MEDGMQRAGTLLVLALVSLGSADQAIAQAKPTKAQKIADAMKAAPRSISASATIMDWPATEGGQMVTLRVCPIRPGLKGTIRCAWTISGCRS
jgi:hypothetical protein